MNPNNPFQQPPQNNPYATAPQNYSNGRFEQVYTNTNPPVFSMIMIIISLILSVLRVLLVGLGIVGYFLLASLEESPPGFALAIPEILTGAGIAFFGILGNSLLLARKKIGVTLAWVMVGCVVASLLVGILQGVAMLNTHNQGSPEWIGAVVGIVVTIAIRIAILACYVIGLQQYRKWLAAT